MFAQLIKNSTCLGDIFVTRQTNSYFCYISSACPFYRRIPNTSAPASNILVGCGCIYRCLHNIQLVNDWTSVYYAQVVK